jgi:hypothetical protein
MLGDAWHFVGSMDEVRLWRVARDEKQIRDNITTKLSGTEEGLLALWNFDDPSNPGRDASPNHHDGKLLGNARVIETSTTVAGLGPPSAENRVLTLDGKDSYAELPAKIVTGLDAVTVEGWVRWDEFGRYSRFFSFGQGDKRLNVMNQGLGGNLWTSLDVGKNAAGNIVGKNFSSSAAVTAGQWVHVAVTVGDDAMKLYLNGSLSNERKGVRMSDLAGDSENRLGCLGKPSASGGTIPKSAARRDG